MGKYGLPVLIGLMGLLYIFFIPAKPEAVKILFKLIPMWLIIAYAYLQFPASRQRVHWIMLGGLFFCMLGDGLLRWFVVGLFAFLIGHLFYMTAFFGKWSFSKLRFAALLPILLYAVYMSTQLIGSLQQDGKPQLIVPVLLYVIVISLMTWSAIMTGNKWAIVGSILFTISDSILSWNMFVSKVAYAGPLIMITYYTAQFCMASSLRTIGTGTGRASTPSLSGKL